MTETNIFTSLFNSMMINYKELYIRMAHVSADKNQYKVCQKLELKLDELKNSLARVNNIIESINSCIDSVYSEYGSIDSVHPELIVNSFTESQSELSYSDLDEENELDCSTISFNTIAYHKAK